MNWKVPFADVRLGAEEKAAVMAVLDSNWLTMGPRTEAFEAAFAAALGGEPLQAVALANCTAALHLALAGLGIKPGDEVIVPSLTFVATVNAARYVGATPVFADVVSAAEWNLDPEDVARKIGPRTRAIVVMHYAGYPARMDRILEIARAGGIEVVEDACHGPLSEWNGSKLGTLGRAGCFSFFGNKNMTTGEGGMLVTADAGLAARARAMRSHGMSSNTYARFKGHSFGYDVTTLGWNYRMDEMRAAMGLVQLGKLTETNRARRPLVERYRARLAERLPHIGVPFAGWNGTYAYHIFPVLLPEGYTDRAGLMRRLADASVQTSIHYRPVHWLSDFGGGETLRLPVTDALAPRILTLPLFQTLAPEQVDYVVEALAEALG